MAETIEDTGFSGRLRAATWRSHEDAANSRYMGALVRGELTLADYGQLVAQHWFAYVALEQDGAGLAEHPDVAPFLDRRILRLGPIEADLAFLLGADWRDHVEPSAATAAYAARITEVAQTWPAGFVAHHYTRYLGDLSGGLFIGRMVRKAFELDGDGVRFYTFDQLDEPDQWKSDYRAHLDAAPWDDDEQERFIDETLAAYAHNTAVLLDLDRLVPEPAPEG